MFNHCPAIFKLLSSVYSNIYLVKTSGALDHENMIVILYLASVKEALQEEDQIKEEFRKLRVSLHQLTSVSQ